MNRESARLPRLPAALLRQLLPHAERREVLNDVQEEYEERRSASGGLVAWLWLWRQVIASTPALARRSWWRGWSGFEPGSDRMKPGGGAFEGMGKDVKFSLRRLRRRPSYLALTVMTLSLGVAGTAAVYSIAKRLLLDPLPYRAEEEVVVFWSRGDWRESELALIRPEITGFSSLAAYRSADATLIRGEGPARLVRGLSASAELFDVLGVSPAMGAGFRPGDDTVGAEPVVVLSHSLWRELGSDRSIVGQTIQLAGVGRTVVGVMPEGFWFPEPSVQAWLAEEVDPTNDVGNYILVGRMEPGLTAGAMGIHLDRITNLLGEVYTYPQGWDKTQNAAVEPVRDFLVGPVRPSLVALLGAMVVILMIACANVAALMLGQVDSRGSELAVRTAIGAARPQLLRQLLIESLVIGVIAGVVGAGLAVLTFRLLVSALPLGALAETAALDWNVFLAAMATALIAATMVAITPGVSVARGDLRTRLSGTRTGGVLGRGGRLESGLVIAQVALVLLMASGAALLIRSVANLRALETGVEVEDLAIVDVVLPVTHDMSTRPVVVRELLGAVEGIPGVVSAAATQRLPLRGSSDNWGTAVEALPDLPGTTTFMRIVSPDYLQTMGIRLVNGRGLLETDRFLEEEGVVVVNQAFVDRFFPATDPLGQRIAFTNRWDRIVGVVDDVAEGGLAEAAEPARYMLYEHIPGFFLDGQTIVLRHERGRDPATILDQARRAIQAAAPTVAVREMTTMSAVFDRAIGPARQVMWLLTLLSGLALALGVVGVYGVVSHFVGRRTREWGIRLALGMLPKRVVRQIVGTGGALVGIGIAVGIAAFLALARVLASFLHEVSPADPLSMAAAAAIVTLAGLVAAFVPARRASRIDPVLALRDQ